MTPSAIMDYHKHRETIMAHNAAADARRIADMTDITPEMIDAALEESGSCWGWHLTPEQKRSLMGDALRAALRPIDQKAEVKPVAKQWRAVENGEPRTSWKDPELGDMIGWDTWAAKSGGSTVIEWRDLYASPSIVAPGVITALDDAMRAMNRCEHDGGFDRETGPIGCDLGDKCVCIGVFPLVAEARRALAPAIVGDGDEAFRQLLLIKHLAEHTTERNWADKRLYIIQAASRAPSTTKPAQGDGE